MSNDGLRSLNLNLLASLDALLAEENVTRAAKRMGVTQSAMSHALQKLRGELGDPLLVKTPRGMTLTPRARDIRAPLRRGLAQVETALAPAHPFEPSASHRRFTIAAGDYFAVDFLPELVRIVSTEASGVDLVLRPPDLRADPARLEAGELDVLVTVQLPQGAQLRTRRLFEETFVCVVRVGHPEVGERLSLETYVRLPHLLISPTGGGSSFVDDALALRGLSRRVALRVPYFLAAPLVVAHSDLVLTAPRRVAENLARYLPLRLLPPPLEVGSFAMHAIWHERDEHDPAHRWLRDTLVRATTPIVTSRAKPPRGRARTPRT